MKKKSSNQKNRLNHNMKKSVLIVLSVLLFASCSTRKEIVYFQDIDKVEQYKFYQEYEPKIEENDVLRINVFSQNQEVAAPFNLSLNRNTGGGGIGSGRGGVSSMGGSGGGGNNNAVLDGYLVDSNGDIRFPVLGKISVKGMTRGKLEAYLTREIQQYVRDAVVQVRIVNFKVTMMGEVQNEGVVQVSDERITVPEALAMAGGITYGGKRENILIIRNDGGQITHGWVDLTEADDVFKNPFYFLKQNDIVYVEPTYRQVKSAGFITSYTGILSLASTVISLIILFTR